MHLITLNVTHIQYHTHTHTHTHTMEHIRMGGRLVPELYT